MSRWSLPIKMTDHSAYGAYLDAPGCYEIGYFRRGVFTAYYVGRSSNLRLRIATYLDERRCHNVHIQQKLRSQRHHLYFRVLRTDRHHGLEARLQRRYGVGRDGAYSWNRRIEWANIWR